MSTPPKEKPETGIVIIHGREYQTVALRIRNFREAHPMWCVACDVVERNVDCVVMRCIIADETGRTIATGYAEEYRATSGINKTSALENCETSAIGRALAAAGYGGTEFASANEVENAITSKPEAHDSLANKPVDEGQVSTLVDWVNTTDSDMGKFCAVFGVSTIEELPAGKYEAALAALKNKAAKVAA